MPRYPAPKAKRPSLSSLPLLSPKVARNPITHHPDFPEPIPQDTYYYNLLHHPPTLLWYMKLYTERFKDDERYKEILQYCENITPHEWPAGPYPHFPEPAPPQ